MRIIADDENNAVLFWEMFEKSYPGLARDIRANGFATVNRTTWELIKQLPGFADGPAYARQALILED